ncbi:rhomboid-like protein [Williamsia sterculiae]|uniref:Rhomboid family protein n=1 Tax=Williamsia sterculiae TaxID=1344003 RepID=A0A1N7EPM9_9NOCA|nr:rhomboid-like protein [Williamsia sterculiae]SIR89895.1 hypothetical protein SAMN05445060_1522 [Williamsia sterculiae]
MARRGASPTVRPGSRLRIWSAAWLRYIRRAPGTFVWLLILLGTTIAEHVLPAHTVTHLLLERSTNLHHLRTDPWRVLFVSAMWVDGGYWLVYLLFYNAIHVPAERWLGTVRWLAVVVISHVGATYISQAVLYWAIQHGRAPASRADVVDIGVSYALVGVAGVLTYRLPMRWRPLYALAWLGLLSIPLWGSFTFTDVGHFTSMLIGLLCYPITRTMRRPRPAATVPESRPVHTEAAG